MKISYKYSKNVTEQTNNKVNQEIVNSVVSMPEMLKEIKNICRVANKRVQMIEKSNLISPALESLGDKKNFDISNMSWEDAKREYCRALAFLNMPTSSIEGILEFEEQMKKALNITDDTIKCHHIVMIVKKAFENVTSLVEVNNAKMVYSCIQQSLNRDKIFNEKERYEILQFVSTVIFDFSHENTDIKIECLTLCHNLVKDILTKKAKIDFMKYQMNMLHEIDTKTQEIVNPYFGLKGVIFD